MSHSVWAEYLDGRLVELTSGISSSEARHLALEESRLDECTNVHVCDEGRSVVFTLINSRWVRN
jgi:hypothetical protein